jgi:hypothetical protein
MNDPIQYPNQLLIRIKAAGYNPARALVIDPEGKPYDPACTNPSDAKNTVAEFANQMSIALRFKLGGGYDVTLNDLGEGKPMEISIESKGPDQPVTAIWSAINNDLAASQALAKDSMQRKGTPVEIRPARRAEVLRQLREQADGRALS